MITIGVDEVGRGCWAGPLVAGAVALHETIPNLRDSKKLSKVLRTKLDIIIREQALAFGLGWVWPAEIDEHGLSWAVKTAMERAMATMPQLLKYDQIIIDGNVNYFAGNPMARAIIKADDCVPAASAASIIAKVARDAYMAKAAEQYAGYGFESHVGYGTAAHITALKTLGATDLHRHSYRPIRELLA